MNRKGLGLGRGKGYLNLIPRDGYVHSISAKGIKSKIKVTYVGSNILSDFAGMNHFAGKEMHFHPLPKKNEMFVDRELPMIDKAKTILHEATEIDLMRHGHPYWSAHKEALKSEKLIHAMETNPFKFQNANQEEVIHSGWKKGNVYRYMLEGSGDIFRELAYRSDEHYIMEKITRIREYIKKTHEYIDWDERDVKDFKERYGLNPKETMIHPEDSFEYSYKENKGKFEKLKELWKKQPSEDVWQEKAIELNLALLDKRFTTSSRLMDEIEKHVKKTSVTINAKGVVPIIEDEHNKRLRKNRGYTAIVVVDAQKLKDKYERDQKEKLAWSPERLEHLNELTQFDAYPQVWFNDNGTIDVMDGRHRISVSASKGLKIPVATRPKNKEMLAQLQAKRK